MAEKGSPPRGNGGLSTSTPLSGRPVLLIGMLMVAVFFSMASRAIFSPLMPSLQNDLGFSLSTAGSLFLIVSVSYAVTMLFCGFLAARIGHGLTIVAALFTIAAGLLMSAFASGTPALMYAMVLIGAGAGTYPPSGIVIINTRISLDKRGTAFSFHEIGPNLALLVSPLLVLALEPWFGWRGVLVWMAAVCVFAALAFWRWGAADAGYGAPPKLGTISAILKMRSTLVGMATLSAAMAGLQGVYAILPAYLVSEYSFTPQYVNVLLTISRIAGVLLLLRTGWVIGRFGRRRVISWVMLFTALFTGAIGFMTGTFAPLVIVLQPALLAMMTPPLLSAIADIGETRYQNITYGLIITVGVGIGGGVAPALLGVMGDFGLGRLGFVALAGCMALSVLFMARTPGFGQDRRTPERPAVPGKKS